MHLHFWLACEFFYIHCFLPQRFNPSFEVGKSYSIQRHLLFLLNNLSTFTESMSSDGTFDNSSQFILQEDQESRERSFLSRVKNLTGNILP